MTSLRVIRDAGEGFIGCQEARKARGQAGLEDRKVRRYEGRLFRVKSLSLNPLAPLGRGLVRGAYHRIAAGGPDVRRSSRLRR